MKHLHALAFLISSGVAVFGQSPSGRDPVPPPESTGSIPDRRPNFNLDGRPMSGEECAEADRLMRVVLESLRNDPLFKTDGVELRETPHGFEMHTVLARYEKNFPNSKGPEPTYRNGLVDGPCGDGFHLKVWYRNYGVLMQLVANQFLREPYGATWYGVIRPQSRHFEIAYTFSFAFENAGSSPWDPGRFPAQQHSRMALVRKCIKEQLGPTERGVH